MKNSAKIILEKNGLAKISGVLSFDTVVHLRAMGDALLKQHDKLIFDFKDVTRSDSSGIALMTAWMRSARNQAKTIEFSGLPEQLIDIAIVSGLDKVLPIRQEIRA